VQEDVLVMVLAGGEGRRLRPLTGDRAKPAVPFGGRYRIIDFVLSNFVNSGFFRINVITQYMSDSLSRHISRGWHLPYVAGQFIDVVPAQQRTGKHWYLGSADAIYQNLNLLRDHKPEHVAVFGGDHIYKMDVRDMLDFHVEREAVLTIAAIPVPVAEATQFGIMEVDTQGRVIGFEEKPAAPKEIPGRPGWALASMGNYFFKSDALVDLVSRDADDSDSAHDFGKNILTDIVASSNNHVYVYDFSTNHIPGQPETERGYWRDVGTIDAYWQASMDLTAIVPEFDLYNHRWPIRTQHAHLPPAKVVHNDPSSGRTGTAVNSIVSEGCVVSGGFIRRSILCPQVRINSYSSVEECVLFDRVDVGRRAKLKRAIIDKGVQIPPDTMIGYDLEADRERFYVSDDGIVVVPKGYVF
jgi:glucose-1-phosphate adenylyltransferase